MKAAILISYVLIICCGIVVVRGDGKLTYGDKCSVQNAILRVFTNVEVTDEKCRGDQGLICTGTCTCPPTRVWEPAYFFGLFGSSSCIAGANAPCTKNDKCVENAFCGENLPLCFCKDGYHAHELRCISSRAPHLKTSVSSSAVLLPMISFLAFV